MLDWKLASEELPPLDTWVFTCYEGLYRIATRSISPYHKDGKSDWYEDLVPSGERKRAWDGKLDLPLSADTRFWWAPLNHPPGVSDENVRTSHEDED